MATPVNLYPLSTVDGKHVPLDVIKPIGLVTINFGSTVDGTGTITSTGSLVVLRSSADCFIKFDTSVAKPANESYASGLLFLEAGEVMTVAPLGTSISVIGLTNSGTLFVQEIHAWAALNNPNRFNRG